MRLSLCAMKMPRSHVMKFGTLSGSCILKAVAALIAFSSLAIQADASGLTPGNQPVWGPIKVDSPRLHQFYVKCVEPKAPSGGGLASANRSTVPGEDPYDARTQRGQDMIRQLEAQKGVVWWVRYSSTQASGPQDWSYSKSRENAARTVAYLLDPKSMANWWLGISDAWIEAEIDCGTVGGSGAGSSEAPWFTALKQLNPGASPEMLQLTADALVEPSLLYYGNYFQGLATTFIARQGGGVLGEALFSGATGNFYPASGTPGGVIGEYAQLFAYNLDMFARLRSLYQATLDNAVSGIDYSVDQLQEAIRFSEQLEETHLGYLMPTGKSFTAGDYRQLTSGELLEAVGAGLFEPFFPGQYIFFPPDPEAEQANVRVAPTAGGFEVTATSVTDPGRSIRVVLPDLGSWFDPARFLPGGAAENGIYNAEGALSVAFTASSNNGRVINGTKVANAYSYFLPAFLRWVEGDSVVTDPVLSAIRDYWRTNPIAINPLTTGAWFFSFSEPGGTPALGLSDLAFFYRADGRHLVHFVGELPSRANPQLETIGFEGLGEVNPANSQDDRVPLRITVTPDQAVTLPVGGTLTLNGTILGKGPVTDVKWRANQVAVQDGGLTFTKKDMQPHDSGYYTLTASNAFGLASSLPVLVDVKGGSKDANANLLGLEVAGAAELAPDFLPAVRSYSVTIPENVLTIAVTPSVEADAQIKVRINGGVFQSVASGATSQPLTLGPSANTVEIQVTAADGTTRKIYTIDVVRGGDTVPTPTPPPTPTPTPPPVADSAPPELEGLAFEPGQVDVNSASATIAVAARITDNLAGLQRANSYLRFDSPSGAQSVYFDLESASLQSGNELDATYRQEILIPRYAESGQWKAGVLWLQDTVGNEMFKSGSELDAYLDGSGLPNSFVVLSDVSDAVPPQLESLVIEPDEVDVESASATVAVTVRITDDLAGVHQTSSYLRFDSPSGNQFAYVDFDSASLQSGDDLDGTYRAVMVIPRHAESGQWTVAEIWLTDSANNGVSESGADAAAYLDGLGYPASFLIAAHSQPSPEPSPVVSPTPTPGPTPTEVPSPPPTPTPVPTPMPTSPPSPTPNLPVVPTAPPTATPLPSPSPTPGPTPTAVPSPTPTPTAAVSPTPTPAAQPVKAIKVLPPNRTIKAGNKSRIMILVSNDSTEDQTVDVIFDSDNGREDLEPQEVVGHVIKGKSKSGSKPRITRVPAFIYTDPDDAAGSARITARLRGVISLPSEPCLVTIKAAKK